MYSAMFFIFIFIDLFIFILSKGNTFYDFRLASDDVPFQNEVFFDKKKLL